jgi:hypothetical protein
MAPKGLTTEKSVVNVASSISMAQWLAEGQRYKDWLSAKLEKYYVWLY